MYYLLATQSARRSLLLCPDKQDARLPALEMQPLETTGGGRGDIQIQARFQSHSSATLGAYRPLLQFPIFGCLGVINVLDDAFVIVVTEATRVGQLSGSEIFVVNRVECFSITSDRYDTLPTAEATVNTGAFSEADVVEPTALGAHPCAGLIKLLSGGTFYYAVGEYELSRTTQYSYTADNPTFDPQYVWNHQLIKNLQRVLDSSAQVNDMETTGLLIPVIQGYVGICNMQTGSEKFVMAVVSRVSSARAGTRYNTRGIDDQGAVANFVETEMIYFYRSICFSYVQVRGSVPIFWDQPGLQVMGHKIQISRLVVSRRKSRAAEATRPAFERHFQDLLNRYGSVYIVNLLSRDSGGEGVLGSEYRQQVTKCAMANQLRMVEFDFHAECKGTNYGPLSYLITILKPAIKDFGCFIVNTQTQEVMMMQRGVMRTNCVDCLDRTNVVQGLLAEQALEHFKAMDESLRWMFSTEEYILNFKGLWADNGDLISRIYAGTGALKSGFTRNGKRTLAGLLDDSVKSVNRFVINNFQDKARQVYIDQLLGRAENQREVVVYDPVLEAVRKQISERQQEYTSYRDLYIHAATYNVNGKLPIDGTGGFKESLNTWLSFAESTFIFSAPDLHSVNLTQSPGATVQPDLFVVGFQEIVELTPNQIVAADPWKRQQWQQALFATISSGNQQYVLVRDGQLVGAAIFVYAKAELAGHIRAVEMCIKKTGLRGMAGNKGGITVRLDVYDSSFCFVTAHFAAGMSNVEERNRDYHTINNETVFKRGKRIQDHEAVFWLGDFNYRINLENDECRTLIDQGDVTSLLHYDQLLDQMHTGQAFVGYKEGAVAFLPTYKYDNGTDRYDTRQASLDFQTLPSNRVPAWCDRILYAGPHVALLEYARAELRVSDHKPVKALFKAQCTIVDRARRKAISDQAYQQRSGIAANAKPAALTNPFAAQAKTANALISLADEDKTAKLPPPSSDTQQWWNTGPAPIASYVAVSAPLVTPGFTNPQLAKPAYTPAGAGKGTQSKFLKRDFPTLHPVAAGDILRTHIRNGTPIGIAADKHIRSGRLLDDDMISRLMQEELRTLADKPLLFDGFPRTLGQAHALSKMTHMTAVVNLDVPKDVIMGRILNRWIHAASGRTYHDTYNPPRDPGKDDVTGEPLVKRIDDNRETVLTRLREYDETIQPLLDYYGRQGILHTMTGKSSDELYPNLKTMVAEWMR
ncbi:Inositol-1,4,5-trisphosphate 5-phosphatase 1 [Sorochytrium milnesiophthora]